VTRALVTFLGRRPEQLSAGYRKATYRFPDGTLRTTSFFGLTLAENLAVDRLVILGTCSSMWGVLVEHVAAGSEQEDARLALLEAEASGNVEQSLLDGVSQLLKRGAGREVVPRLIPFGRNEPEQRDILQTISTIVRRGEVHFDLTHGFRHLGMVGMLSAFMLERIGHLTVRSLWYGALDMSEAEVTPVLRLDGLNAIERWIAALDRFDGSGDYGVFAPLLQADGVAADKARCLQEAAFFERNLNLSDAARKLQTFRMELDDRLPGASGLFQDQLGERLKWIDERELWQRQRVLARQYLARSDFVRAAAFTWEALVSRECVGHAGEDWETREAAAAALDQKAQSSECDERWRKSFHSIRILRNALAHGAPPRDQRFRDLLAFPERLHAALQSAIDRLLR
jgi:CRISPR-associated Csx2 family protein